MRVHSSLLTCFLLILAIFTAGCTETISENGSTQNIEKTPKLNLTIVPEKTDLEKGETFNIYLTLTNVGNNTLNVWKMEQQISYDISFRSLADNNYVTYLGPVISRPLLTNEFLVELKPGESLNATYNSRFWDLNSGEYMLSAVYQTGGGERISKPYWRGEIKSNEVLIKVLDTQNNLTASLLTETPQIRK